MYPQDLQYIGEPWAASIDLAGRELISLVGAGGKSSLMLALAGELALAGQRVIATTTTRIWRSESRHLLVEPDPERMAERLKGLVSPGEWLTLAQAEEEVRGGIKLVGPPPEAIDEAWLSGAAEYVIVEADGSRRLPLKAPRPHEPVIPAETTIVIGLVGLSALGQPLDEEHVCGADLFAGLTGCRPGELVGPGEVVKLVLHPEGLFKNAPEEARRILFLNQADEEGASQAGQEILHGLARQKAGLRVILGSIQRGGRDVYDLAGEV